MEAAELFAQEPSYQGDFLATWNKSVDFLKDARFVSAYRRGSNLDIHIEWRIHTCCWAAAHARNLLGDFVECGVNTGIMSLAVCEYIDFNSTDKTFWLFDTFNGTPLEQLTEEERMAGRQVAAKNYFECYELTCRNFAAFSNARLVKGRIPDSFAEVVIGEVAYLSIDMNIVVPELAALEFFWPKLVPGAVVVLDDYGWKQCAIQKRAHDAFARSVGVEIMLLPTGQG
jgi:O-methyltransferase